MPGSFTYQYIESELFNSMLIETCSAFRVDNLSHTTLRNIKLSGNCVLRHTLGKQAAYLLISLYLDFSITRSRVQVGQQDFDGLNRGTNTSRFLVEVYLYPSFIMKSF
jgi:hypothetical protein